MLFWLKAVLHASSDRVSPSRPSPPIVGLGIIMHRQIDLLLPLPSPPRVRVSELLMKQESHPMLPILATCATAQSERYGVGRSSPRLVPRSPPLLSPLEPVGGDGEVLHGVRVAAESHAYGSLSGDGFTCVMAISL